MLLARTVASILRSHQRIWQIQGELFRHSQTRLECANKIRSTFSDQSQRLKGLAKIEWSQTGSSQESLASRRKLGKVSPHRFSFLLGFTSHLVNVRKRQERPPLSLEAIEVSARVADHDGDDGPEDEDTTPNCSTGNFSWSS